MKRRARSWVILAGLVPLSLLLGCWWPEKFTAALEINSDKSYSFRYDGTLAFMPAVAEIKQSGKVDPEMEKELRQMAEKLSKEPGVKSCAYKGDGRFLVLIERSGRVDRRVSLPWESLDILTLAPSGEGVQVTSMSPHEMDRKEIEGMGLKLDGTVNVISGLRVVEHNAQSTPFLGGLIGSYGWHLTLDSTESPKVLLSKEAGRKPVVKSAGYGAVVLITILLALGLLVVVILGLFAGGFLLKRKG